MDGTLVHGLPSDIVDALVIRHAQVAGCDGATLLVRRLTPAAGARQSQRATRHHQL